MSLVPLSSILHLSSSLPISPSSMATTAALLSAGGTYASSSSALRSSNGRSSDTPKDSSSDPRMHQRGTGSSTPPRARAVTYMASAASLHYAGYEFLRNAGLALFTSDTMGFSSSAAFPLATAAVSPFSLLLLAGYGHLLSKRGPRAALKGTTAGCIAFIVVSSVLLQAPLPKYIHQSVIGIAFLFQNSYTYTLAGQHWSFTDSVVTPDEGAKWFGILTGITSLLCTGAALAVPLLLPITGLIGLYSLTAVTLTASMLCADRAYAIAQKNGFDPALQQKKTTTKSSKVSQVRGLFSRVPILRALFCEGIAFQSLSTILNVAMIQTLKVGIPNDMARSAYTGRFYAMVSAASAAFQFVLFPLFMKFSEPSLIWRLMPIVPMAICLIQATYPVSSTLSLVTAALFSAKVMDYAIRTVICNMVYQPLDFESRFMGKEIIGVFGSRFGKSGMSLLLSGLGALAGMGLQPLYYMSLTASTAWCSTTWWLAALLPNKAQAQKMVEDRKRKQEQ